ncbi:hypothetical protein CF392_08785 [Tamilnaduibacter salinus]|uniref:O-antigen ligase-related domain-containing protein n=1 Tax=Tamilnaduibacter salinus TaxID=1484056 RepID=A0A2A2I2C6_9GAMM|nr:O-antigen ligase family protein [Tamilnaduibacter salinus]PAV25879.1 hypothetical protein CF392_08785 [Tamilnaduibacter salinus]
MTDMAAAPAESSVLHRTRRSMPALFLLWLVTTVVGPWDDAYRLVFHALLIPATLVVLYYGIPDSMKRDPLLRLTGAFFAYVAVSSFLVGPNPISSDLKILRWALEAFVCAAVLWLFLSCAVRAPLRWGRLMLGVALLGAVAALTMWSRGRLEGLGALQHPIQGSSILLAYLAVGNFLLIQGLSRWRWQEFGLVFLACLGVACFIFFGKSRGPILAFAVYVAVLLPLSFGRINLRMGASIFLLVFAASLAIIEWQFGLSAFVDGLIDRGDSKRLTIWTGYLLYPPDSLLLGHGGGVAVENTNPANQFWEPNNLYVPAHAHNLWIGTYAENGLIGVGFLAAIFGMLIRTCWVHSRTRAERRGLLGLLALVLMLTLTDEHTLVLSLKPIWLFAWLPMILVWLWLRRDGEDQSSDQSTLWRERV